MVKFHETKTRSVTKAISYRAIIILADGLVIFLLTHRYALALLVVIVSNIYSTILYFAHERLWDRLKWGKIKT